MTTTWPPSGPISHPWFKQASTKRKLSLHDDSPTSSRSRSHSPSPPLSKRRKQNTILEAGFSSLSLTNAEPSASGGLPYVSELDTDYSPMESDEVCVQEVIEEPGIPEVKMKSSSWYEPEPDRIVVTTLDSSDEEDEVTDADTTTLTIPPALLKELMSQPPRPPILGPKNGNHALVLFKPLSVPGREDDKKTGSVIFKDDDAMDVGP
ncbi:hypothetical protein C0991_004933 [Blastosporella zonata]|nr:hypothetical protein C0991_004933 [Blastosporella zonata]